MRVWYSTSASAATCTHNKPIFYIPVFVKSAEDSNDSVDPSHCMQPYNLTVCLHCNHGVLHFLACQPTLSEGKP